MYKKKQTEDICLREFTKVVEQGTRSNRFVLPTSHYPLACSGSSEDCVITRLTLKEYFDLMFANKVSLYIGAHAHTYQRIHPYFKNGSFVPVREYHAGHDYLLSIVEGVAGNDKSIVESIDKILDETAAWTIN